MDLITLGTVARQLGIPRHRVSYAIERAGIEERGRAGILRLFAPDQLAEIRAAVEAIRPCRVAEGVEETEAPK